MKTFTKLSATVLMLASLGLTACAQELPNDRNRVQGASSPSSAAVRDLNDDKDYTGTKKINEVPAAPKNATIKDIPKVSDPAPTEVAKGITEQASDKPLNIDIQRSINEHADPALTKTFPAKEFDVAAGVRFGLSTYQDLVQTKNFYDPRDGLKDAELIAPYLDRFDDKIHTAMLESIKEHGKIEYIPAALPNGVFATTGGDNSVDIVPVSMPDSTWGTPSLEVKYDDDIGNYIKIIGIRRLSIDADNGKKYEAIVNYNVGVSPSGDGWLVNSMGWNLVSLEEVK